MADQDDDTVLPPRLPPPAEGERRAIVGYSSQYRVSASLIWRGLRDGSLQWIRILDPEAGRVDDLQIGSQSRVDAYQIKWSQYHGNFSFRDLTQPLRGSPCLLAQLADGWKRLREVHPGYRVVVHLITNRVPSAGDRLPVNDPPPRPSHFAAFLEQVWKPFRAVPAGLAWPIPYAWDPAWQAARSASGLSAGEFESFVRDCDLELASSLPQFDELTALQQQNALADLEQIADLLFGAAADPQRVISFTRDELVARLGWERRFEFRSGHSFPVDDALYEPIEGTVRQLEDALTHLPGGYVAVLGTPGSGKSTLLTQTLVTRLERLIRYYAYVPGSQVPILRGESTNFLHDVVLSLHHAGFQTPRGLPSDNRDLLLESLQHQLGLLHQAWQESGRKTVILIDGLDYVARERPIRSLLLDLPRPDDIPDGVFIVLGSQTDQLEDLPPSVQHAIRQSDRRIEMDSLSREAVLRIVDRLGLSAKLSVDQRERVYQLSGGHPLSMAYLLNRLRDAAKASDVHAVLDGTMRYQGSVEEQYHSYWRQIEADDEMTHLLGLLARLRGVIDLSWIGTWAGTSVVARLRRQLGHYFRPEDSNRWYFFHDSFRLYVLDKSAESSPGAIDPSRGRALYHELADMCGKEPAGSIWKWEEMYYRSAAEEHQVVLELASQAWFREQFLGLRPIDAIDADIKLALQSAGACRDPVGLTRVLLAGAELAQRRLHTENVPLIDLLVELEGLVASDHVRDGYRLRIDPATALNTSTKLKRAGLADEADRIFRLAEPLDILAATVPIEDDPQEEKSKVLNAWARAAAHFRDVGEVLGIIRKLRLIPSRFSQEDEETSTRRLRNQLLFDVSLELLDEHRWGDLATLSAELSTGDADDFLWWFWLQTHAWKGCLDARDEPRARGFLEETLARVGNLELSAEESVALAEGAFRILRSNEQTRKWLRDVPQPRLRTDVIVSHDPSLEPFVQRFRLNRLLYALGDQRSPADMVPDPSNPREQGMAYFERALCVLAHIWGEAWRSRQLESSEIVREVVPILRLFNRDSRETHDWTSWYVVQGARAEFYVLLVDASAQHGAQAVEAIRSAFEQEWSNPETAQSWPTDVRRKVVLAFDRHGVSRDWVVEKLQGLKGQMLDGRDASGRVEECEQQGRAWLALGDKESARRQIDRMMRVSFAVGYRKDYQLNTWIEWLGDTNEIEGEKAAERIAWFARAITTLQSTTEGPAARHAANELLAVAHRWSPRRAISLFRFFLDEGVIWHEEAVRVLLRKALETDNPPTTAVALSLANFALPLATAADPELATLLIQQTASSKDNQSALETARHVLSKASIFALPSTRSAWRRGVAHALDQLGLDLGGAGLGPADLRPDREGEGSVGLLRLKDGSLLTLREAKERVSSTSDLQILMAEAADGPWFDWEPIVAHLAENEERGGFQALANLVQTSHRSAQILASVSESLSARGQVHEGWHLGEQALGKSQAYGWNRWYDGGSRIAAFRALVRAEPGKGRELAWDVLIRDLTEEYWYPQSIALNLRDILPLLCDNLPIQEIWSEIEEHARSLFDGSSLPARGPLQLDQQPARDTTSAAIADLLALHIDHPILAVAQAAQRTLASLVLTGELAMDDAMRELLGGTESQQQQALMVLDAVSLRRLGPVAPFGEDILGLHASPNYGIQQAAQDLSERLGIRRPSAAPSATAVRAIYRLSLPPQAGAGLIAPREVSPTAPLPDSVDPVRLVGPWYHHIEAVAEEAGLQAINVCYRAVQIMRDMAAESSWNQQGERRLMNALHRVGLRIAFRRPRGELAHKAMLHVVAELVSARMLDPDQLRQLDEVLRSYDPVMVLTEPNLRPIDIEPIAGGSELGSRHEQWPAQMKMPYEQVKRKTASGLVIMAEETNLRRLEWGTPSETRRSVIRTYEAQSLQQDSGDGSLFARVASRLVAEYPTLDVGAETRPLVVRHEAHGYESPGENWLALNPSVACRLEWNLAEEGLFRWADNDGQTMVESMWWADGLVGQSPPHLEDEVGEGWLVLASEPAWEAIASLLPNLRRVVHVERRYDHEGQPVAGEIRGEEVVS